MEKVFSQSFYLSAGETNAEQEISLALLTSKIIDIATAHANSLGIGNPSMESLGCGWVLSRIAIEMERYPRVNETYTLSTWVEGWNRHFSVRNFKISDSKGEAYGYAISVWMVLNTSTRENAGLSHLHMNPEMISGETVPIGKFGRHPAIVPMPEAKEKTAEAEEKEMPRGAVRATEPAKSYVFQYADLDFYRHVNTVRYVTLLLNQFTLDEMDTTQVRRLEMAFMREGRYGETVSLLRADDGLQTIFSLVDAAAGVPSLSAALVRCPRKRS